jgi:hypothetical protein
MGNVALYTSWFNSVEGSQGQNSSERSVCLNTGCSVYVLDLQEC